MSILKRFVTAPSEASELPKFDVTTYKALVAQRLLTALCIVSAVSYLWALGTGDKEMAKFIFESFLYFFGLAVLGANMGQYGLQRFSSKELKEAEARGVETARLAGTYNEVTTRERPAAHVEHADQVVVPVNSPPIRRVEPTGNAKVDDERGEL